MLQAAYADQGGVVGSGFKTPDDMVANIPFWKLVRRDGHLVAVGLYKDALGRKRVAMATDGTPAGKQAAGEMALNDLIQGRAYGEVSGKSLSFVRKQFDIKPFLVPFDIAATILAKRGDDVAHPAVDDPEMIRHPDLRDFFYTRIIGGEPHTKLMVGTPNISLY